MENNKKLTRASAGNRMVAGVCAGIADYFGWDPTLLRIVYVLSSPLLPESSYISSYGS